MASGLLTPRIVGELLFHEGLAQESYRDGSGVWTWSVGITSASGHRVERYRDNPQGIGRCLEVFVWLLRMRYLPQVLAAFCGLVPAEHQLAAALSFHWNTGAIGRASWVGQILAGDIPAARKSIMDWRRPPAVLPRRRCERDLFFDACWHGDGTVALYDVAKPQYCPTRPRRYDARSEIEALLARPGLGHALPNEVPKAVARRRNWFERLFD